MATYTDKTLVFNSGRTTQMSSSDQLSYSTSIIVADGKGLQGLNATSDVAVTLGDAAGATNFIVEDSAGADVVVVDSDGNMSIVGNLDVTGTIISRDEERVLVADNFLDVNFGHVSTTALSGGVAVNYQSVAAGTNLSINTASNTVTFTAASGETEPLLSAATTSAIPADTFSAGDIVQIAGTTNAENDGFYVVESQGSAGTMDFKSTATTTPDSINFKPAQVNFTADAQTSGTITISKVKVTVLQVKTSNGTWETATGSTDSDFASPGDLGGSTLQEAYELGNTIAMTDAEGGFDVSASSGTPAISLDAAGASNFTVDSAALTLSTTTSGELDLTSAGEMDVNAGANLDIDVTGTFDMLSSSTFSIDGTGASNVTATSGNLTVSTATSGNLALTSVGTATLTSASGSACAITDGVGTLTMTSGALTESALVSIDLTPSGAITIQGGGASKYGDDTATLDFDGAGAVAESGMTSFTITPSGAVNLSAGSTANLAAASGSAVTVQDGVLTLSATSGALSESGLTNCDLSGSGTMTITGGGVSTFGDDTGTLIFGGTGAVTTAGMTTIDLDGSGLIQINSSGGGIAIGNDDIDQLIGIGTAGERAITVGSASATSLTLSSGSQVISTDQILLSGSTVGDQAVCVQMTAGEALAQGEIVYGSAAATVSKADQDGGSAAGDAIRTPLGVANAAISNAATGAIAIAGIVPVKFSDDGDGAAVGKAVYLGATAGVGVQTPPSSGTVYQIGILTTASSSNIGLVAWQPSLIADYA